VAVGIESHLICSLFLEETAITSVMISFQTGGLIVKMLSISVVIVITYIILRLLILFIEYLEDAVL
jgi:hypothetical protein